MTWIMHLTWPPPAIPGGGGMESNEFDAAAAADVDATGIE